MKEHAIWHVFCFHKRVNLSLYENASALRGLEQYQNVIANNIAASHVAGFKNGLGIEGRWFFCLG